MKSTAKWILGLGAAGLGLLYVSHVSETNALAAPLTLQSGNVITPGNYRQLKLGDFMVANNGVAWRVTGIDASGNPMVVAPDGTTTSTAGQLLQDPSLTYHKG